MNQEPSFKTLSIRDTEQLVQDMRTVIFRIELLRSRIALYLLLTDAANGDTNPAASLKRSGWTCLA